MNPVGRDGKTMTCNSCGCYRHLMADCPYKSEYKKSYFEENENPSECQHFDDEHPELGLTDKEFEQRLNEERNGGNVNNTHFATYKLYNVWFTIFSTISAIFTMETVYNMLLLDTGCVQNVCGRKWMENFLKNLSEEPF